MEFCKVLPDGNGNLVVAMPDGKIIPAQTKLSIEQNLTNDDVQNVIITFTGVIVMPVAEFNLVKDLIPVEND